MDLFVAALEKAGPWAIVVLLLYIIWDMQKRNENGIREAIRDQIAALQSVVNTLANVNQALATLIDCLQGHDKATEGMGEMVRLNARSIEEVKALALKIEGKVDAMRGRTARG